ncbi:Cral trio domain protein [Diplogelasinospora grovesii]|uniref:Cral trio domain protein n=1 Tax=Diplogelasinospora grovesii TaxID=303347 RepID=A0AAN6S6D3_9PEZI|nr:Cral trio domain protein [Diplogelasinospora grovesii]
MRASLLPYQTLYLRFSPSTVYTTNFAKSSTSSCLRHINCHPSGSAVSISAVGRSFATTTRPAVSSSCQRFRQSLTAQVRHPYSTKAASKHTLSLLGTFCLGLGLGFTLLYTVRRASRPDKTLTSQDTDTHTAVEAMSAEVAPGRPGNLTAEQEEKLRRLWQLIFQVCGVKVEGENGSETSSVSASTTTTDKTEPAEDGKKTPKKKRMSFFTRRGKKEAESDSAGPTPPSSPPTILSPPKDGEEDKYGQTKHFYDTLASQPPESIRATIWSMVKHDHPDALVLRFLRARKWDVEKALVMLISTMNWRSQEMKVDDDIMRNGELAALEAEKNATDPAAKRLGHDFLEQMRMGKSFVHGVDKEGRPMCFVRVRLHKQGEQVEESLERYTVYLIETCRMLLRPPVDTATIVFDMTGFSMANMDYTPVKFMIKCFEANYPECLGAVLVHKSPWIFQGIWKVIKGWLDPVVANKVHFTNSLKEVEEFVPAKQVPKELEGEEDWEYKYVEPVPGENDKMKDTQTRDRLLAARELLVKEYEAATINWIKNPTDDSIKAKRDALAARLREDYWNLDPYVRARSFYDRTGVLLPGGKTDYYPQGQKKVEDEKVNRVTNALALAHLHVETSADDVD